MVRCSFCAEMIFLHMLITEKVGASSKLATVQRVLSLMDESVDVPETLVPALSGGLCNPGRRRSSSELYLFSKRRASTSITS